MDDNFTFLLHIHDLSHKEIDHPLSRAVAFSCVTFQKLTHFSTWAVGDRLDIFFLLFHYSPHVVLLFNCSIFNIRLVPD
nr:MAG TPA: hypothetical protein [Caudoviricetes sp.]